MVEKKSLFKVFSGNFAERRKYDRDELDRRIMIAS